MSQTVYIIVGPTAVGKTSFAIELAKKLNTQILSADARQCFKELNIGVARPSENELSKVNGSVLLDGYPRTIAQAENLDRLLDNLTVIWLDVPEDVTIQRNLERGKTSKRPDDANVDVIKQRLDNYNKETAPVKEWYDKSNRVIEVDGVGPIPEVLERIKSFL